MDNEMLEFVIVWKHMCTDGSTHELSDNFFFRSFLDLRSFIHECENDGDQVVSYKRVK
jgi:hypothetical protein